MKHVRPYCTRLGVALAALGLCCTVPVAADPPARVVSMNLCTDQLAMLIAAPGQLVSVSDLAGDPRLSVLAEDARMFPANKGAAEEIFLLRPNLVLAGSYAVDGSIELLRRLGFRVEQFSPATSFDDVRTHISRIGDLLGQQEKAADILADFAAALAAARASRPTGKSTLTYEPNGYTLGNGTLTGEIIEAAGYENLAARLGVEGMRMVSLEAVVMHEPDVVMTSQGWGKPALADESGAHPVLKKSGASFVGSVVPNKYLICGTPFVTNAVELIRALKLGEGTPR